MTFSFLNTYEHLFSLSAVFSNWGKLLSQLKLLLQFPYHIYKHNFDNWKCVINLLIVILCFYYSIFHPPCFEFFIKSSFQKAVLWVKFIGAEHIYIHAKKQHRTFDKLHHWLFFARVNFLYWEISSTPSTFELSFVKKTSYKLVFFSTIFLRVYC